MRFAIDVPNVGDFADPTVVAELALALGRARVTDESGTFGTNTDPRAEGRWGDLESADSMLRRTDQGPPRL